MPPETTGQGYAARVIRKNPALFATGKPITIKPEELLKQLSAAYDAGQQDVRAAMRESMKLPDGFEALFGGR